MNAFILAVGDEVLCGDVVNTNAAYIARELDAIGIETIAHSVVNDGSDNIKSEFKRALNLSDIIITTGGLGPTKDDITKESIAECLNIKLTADEAAADVMRNYFKSRDVEFTPNNLKQTYIPEGAVSLNNNFGTAAGIYLEYEDKVIIMFPGPPMELIPMFEEYAKPILIKKTEKHFAEKYYMIANYGESMAEQKLRDNLTAKENYTLNTYIIQSGVMIKAVAHADSESEAQRIIDENDLSVKELFSDKIYSEIYEELWHTVGSKLIKHNLTISAAESLSGGMFSEMLVECSGISSVFKGSVVCYSEEIKANIVGVKRETLEKYGAVSGECAMEMAGGIREKFDTDIGVALTGIAGPSGGTEEKPVGLVYICINFKGKSEVLEYIYNGSRERIRKRSVSAAYFALNRIIEESISREINID